MKIPKFQEMLEQIHEERGIKKEDIIAALEEALLLAAKRRFPEKENLTIKLSEKGESQVFDGEEEVTPSDFGRLAAQTAKQVIIQRIREAEKDIVYNEYITKVGQLITGTIQRKEPHGYLIDLGKLETYLAASEAIPGENLHLRDRVKLVILEVKKTVRGPLVVVSRAHPDFIKCLFELEVPEISEKVLEIKAIAREAGRRTKIAIKSNDSNVGVIGTCVGQMGSRIQNITREIGGERIDIIEWSDKADHFIKSALSPAKATSVEINEVEKSAVVTLPVGELSLAIGKEGQNVRLAAKLTGYKIDIAANKETEKLESGGKSDASKKDAQKNTK